MYIPVFDGKILTSCIFSQCSPHSTEGSGRSHAQYTNMCTKKDCLIFAALDRKKLRASQEQSQNKQDQKS